MMSFRLALCLTAVVLIVFSLCACTTVHAQSDWQERALGVRSGATSYDTGAAMPAPGKQLSRRWIIHLMEQEIDLKELQKLPSVKLSVVFRFMQESLKKSKGVDLPILLIADQFTIENPDAPHVLETEVSFAQTHQRMKAVQFLRFSLTHVPTKNATFLVRRGALEITTVDSLIPEELVKRRIFASFVGRPLPAAIAELCEQTGANIILDPRLGARRETRVRADFINNPSLGEALIVLSNLAGAEPAILGQSIVLTTPANAQRLRAWRAEAMWHHFNWPRGRVPPILGLGI